ncbi:MAG: S8 family peptidase [Bacteroidota bacterium]
MLARLTILFAFCLLMNTYLTAQAENNGQNDLFAPNRLIVSYVDGTNLQERTQIRNEYFADLETYLPKLNIEIWILPQFPFNSSIGDTFNDIFEVQGNAVRRAKVDGAGLDYISSFPQSDNGFCNGNFPQPYNPIPCCVDADVYCGVDTNLVKIGIIDTGADVSNPEPYYPLYNVFANGYDFVADVAAQNDDNGHGTQMTSIIGGLLDAQAAQNIEIYPLRALDGSGTGLLSDIIEAVHFAICDTINILNLSLGYKTDKADLFDQFFKDVLQQAIANNILVIVAAGNQGECIGINNPYYPASFDLDGMITVGAAECIGAYAPFSNYGNPVDVLTPGVDIFCETLGNAWVYASGTSHAAALTTAMAASFASKQDDFDALAIQDTLLVEQDTCVAKIVDTDISCHPNFGASSVLRLTMPSFRDTVYTAFDTICSRTFIPKDVRITYKAGESIVLKPGFQVENGACFAAAIFTCTPFQPVISHPIPNQAPILAVEKPLKTAHLAQNHPNPFYDQTQISYFIPDATQTAQLTISSHTGELIRNIPIVQSGTGTIQLNQISLPKGIYFYTLYVDGVAVLSRKMLSLDE